MVQGVSHRLHLSHDSGGGRLGADVLPVATSAAHAPAIDCIATRSGLTEATDEPGPGLYGAVSSRAETGGRVCDDDASVLRGVLTGGAVHGLAACLRACVQHGAARRRMVRLVHGARGVFHV